MCRTGAIMKRGVTACLVLSALLLAGLPSAADTVFASNHLTFPTPSKLLCVGEPNLSSPASCTTTTSPGPGAAVFYAIKLGPNTPAGSFTLLETLPQGFNYVSAHCTVAVGTNMGQSTPLVRTVSNPVSTFSLINLLSGQTVYCFIRGYFTNPGVSVTNSVTVADQNGAPISSGVTHNAIVATSSLLPSDLSVVKTVVPGLVDVTQGAQTLTYTVVIKNNGPEDVWIGTIGELFDNVSISTTSVPMQVKYVIGSGACTSSPSGTACLAPIPALVLSGWNTVTTTPLAFAKWQFPSAGPNAAGYIPSSLGTITLTYQIEVRRHPELVCAKGGEMLRNTVLFGLTRMSGVTITESNELNNTSASPDVPVNTGQQNDPECALPDLVGPIQIVKTQDSPSSTSTVLWGSPVLYRVTVTNSDPSPITVRLRDRVMQWAGTPPFFATVQSWNCVLAPACATSPLATTTPPPVNLFSYFQTQTAWDKSNLTVPGKLNGVNGMVVLNIVLRFTPNSCDSFANGDNIIRNIGRVNYDYVISGSPPGTPPTSFMAEAFVDTKMARRPLCKLRVKKTVFPATTTKVNFGSQINYKVTYRNGGTTAVSVGTLIDAVRIVQPNYATSLPFNYKYKCMVVSGSVSGSPGAVPTMSLGYPAWIPGSIVHTTFPSQGARIIQNSAPISFSPSAQLDCSVQIKVFRPASGDPNCLSSVTPRLENLALMDVSRFYNPNVPWPPSPTYTSSFSFGATQPTSPLTNWSTVGLKLPKCYKFVVNKTVTPNLTWAPGGPSPLNYTVVVTNRGDALTGSGTFGSIWFGPFLGDQFFTPSSGTIVSGSVTVTSDCNIPPNQLMNWDGVPAQSRLRISSFPAGCTITLSFQVAGPFTPSQTCNRGFAGISTGPVLPTTDWYNNSTNTDGLKSEICTPVLNTNSLTVRKSITNNSKDVLPAGALFPVTVSCSVPGGPTITFSINASSTGPVIVNNIPVGSTCTITESSTLPLPQPVPGIPIDCKAPALLGWQQPTYVPTQVVVIAPAPAMIIVSINNTLNCVGP